MINPSLQLSQECLLLIITIYCNRHHHNAPTAVITTSATVSFCWLLIFIYDFCFNFQLWTSTVDTHSVVFWLPFQASNKREEGRYFSCNKQGHVRQAAQCTSLPTGVLFYSCHWNPAFNATQGPLAGLRLDKHAQKITVVRSNKILPKRKIFVRCYK